MQKEPDSLSSGGSWAQAAWVRNERRQYALRYLFTVILVAWAAVYLSMRDGAPLHWFGAVFALYAGAVAACRADMVRRPYRPARVYLVTAADCAGVGVVVWLTDVHASPAFFVYFFIIMGSMIRYGRRAMAFAAAFSFLSYTTALTAFALAGEAAAHGHVHWGMEAGKLATLAALPLIMSALFRRIEERQEAIRRITGRLQGYRIGEEELSLGMSGDAEIQALAGRLDLLSGEIMRRQKELADQASTLQTLVDERTAELQRQMEKAREADKMKTQFLNNVSHELRTPLHNIIGFSGVLAQPNVDEEKKGKMLGIIGQRARELLEKLEKITEITEIISSGSQLVKAPYNAGEVIRSAVDRYENVAESRSVKISLDINLERNTMIFDQKIVVLIIGELVDNAIKFSGHGGAVAVVARTMENTLLISVSDTGEGIPERDREMIYGLFHQVDGGLNRRYEGLGLGMFLVKSLAGLHEGDIRVESEAGAGSTFTVSLPFTPVGNGG